MNARERFIEEYTIQEAARDGVMVEHDCKDESCGACERWFEARDFWVRDEIKGMEL